MSAGRRLAHDWFDRDLPAGVEIDATSWLYSAYAFIHCASRRRHPLRVGPHSGIYTGSFFDLGPDGEVEIGDYCAIVGAIINVNGTLSIGDYALIAHEVTIADSPWAVPPAPDLDRAPAKATALGANVWIGARATIRSGLTIGEGAIVGAGAIVEEDVPAFAIVAGTPARIVGDVRDRTRRTRHR